MGDHIRWIRKPTLRRPHIVAAFTGWNDAADAASAAVKHLVENLGALPLAEIDPEEFTDFATVRPHVRLSDTSTRQIIWPTVSMWTVDDATDEHDIILVLGPEPSLRWKLFVHQILDVAREYDAASIVILGALLAEVPHRQATQIIGTSADEALIDRYDLQHSRYEGPTGINGVLADMAFKAGIPTISLWAAIPAYAPPQVPSPKAAAALIERLAEIIECDAPTASLDARVERYEQQIDSLIENDPGLSKYIEQLESEEYDGSEYDEDGDYDDDDEESDSDGITFSSLSDDDTEEHEVDPDLLMQEVEQFLRSQGDE